MQQWEYKIVGVPIRDPDEMEGLLNWAGAEGWELVVIERMDPIALFAFFKRQIS